jgi:hypothetical protein
MSDGRAVVSSDGGSTTSPESVVNVGDSLEIAGERRIGVPDGEAGICFVTELNDDGTFNIRWAVENRGEKNVRPSRIVCVNPLAVTARRTSDSELERPSILAPSHQPQSGRESPTASSAASGVARQGIEGIAVFIRDSIAWRQYPNRPNPLIKYLHDGRRGRGKKEKGHFRRAEAVIRGISLLKKGRPVKHLTEVENTL